jgi:DNA mismatch repair protein MutL
MASDFKRENVTKDWERLFEGLGKQDQLGQSGSDFSSADQSLFPESDENIQHREERIIQIANSYIVCPLKSGFVLIDQHAAHVRILYEEFLSKLAEGKSSTQTIAFPSTLELTVVEAELMEMILPRLNAIGYDISAFGQNSYIIRGIPAEIQLARLNEQALKDILADLRETMDDKIDIKERVAIACARTAAIRKGTKLKNEEINLLVDHLFSCKLPDRTPSGNYCLLNFTQEDIERRFKSR